MAGHVTKSNIEQPGGRFATTIEMKGTALTESETSVTAPAQGSLGALTGTEEVSTFMVAERDYVIDDLFFHMRLGASPEGRIMLQIADPDEDPGAGTNVLDRWVDLGDDMTAESGNLVTVASGNAVGNTGELEDNTMISLDILPLSKSARYVKRGQRVDLVLIGEANVEMGLATLVADSRTAIY